MHCNQNYKHLQIRRGNAQRFRSANPVLQSGEIAYGNLPGIKFNIVKIGDGVTPWNDLPCLPFSDPVPYTTSPPVCLDDNFLLLQGGYFDLSFRGTPVGNNGSLENPNYKIPPSSYQFDYEGLAQDSPFVLANYGSKINPLGEDDFSVSFSFYLTNKNGRHSQYGETFPLFTIGDNFNTNSLGEGELSVNLLKTGDNDSSISATFLSFQSDLLKESGISTEILPSAWYDFTLERANNLFTIKIEDETLISYSHTMSGIDLGKDLSSNNFLIGNAYPSGNFNPQFSGILIDNFQATKTCPREYYCVQELPPTTTPPPTTTTTTPSPEGCGFVALGSLTVGILRNGIVYTPDNCGNHVHGCNQPVVEATWKFTSDTNITFNGEEPISSHGSLGNTDLGSIILCSLDCIFATEGSSFHIFDDNDVEIARFTGPCLILGQHLKPLYTGEDVQSTLSNQPASIGGNWGDYITNDRIFFDEELPTTQGEIFLNLPAAVMNLDRPFTRMYQLASATQVHRFEIRTTCTTTTTAAPTTTTTTTAAPTTTTTTTAAPTTSTTTTAAPTTSTTTTTTTTTTTSTTSTTTTPEPHAFVQFFESYIFPNHLGYMVDQTPIPRPVDAPDDKTRYTREVGEFTTGSLWEYDSVRDRIYGAHSIDSVVVGENTKITVYESSDGVTKGNEVFSLTGPLALCGMPTSTICYEDAFFGGNDIDGIPWETKFPPETRQRIETFDHPIGGHPYDNTKDVGGEYMLQYWFGRRINPDSSSPNLPNANWIIKVEII